MNGKHGGQVVNYSSSMSVRGHRQRLQHIPSIKSVPLKTRRHSVLIIYCNYSLEFYKNSDNPCTQRRKRLEHSDSQG